MMPNKSMNQFDKTQEEKKSVVSRINTYRAFLDLNMVSQREIAEVSGFPQSKVHHMLNPRLETDLHKIHKAIDIIKEKKLEALNA